VSRSTRKPRVPASKALRDEAWYGAIVDALRLHFDGSDEAPPSQLDGDQTAAFEAITALHAVVERYKTLVDDAATSQTSVFAANLLAALVDGREHSAIDFFLWSRRRHGHRLKGAPTEEVFRATVIGGVEALTKTGVREAEAQGVVAECLTDLGHAVSVSKIRNWSNLYAEAAAKPEAHQTIANVSKALLERSDGDPNVVLRHLAGLIEFLRNGTVGGAMLPSGTA
jgi:hypothetical protein